MHELYDSVSFDMAISIFLENQPKYDIITGLPSCARNFQSLWLFEMALLFTVEKVLLYQQNHLLK